MMSQTKEILSIDDVSDMLSLSSATVRKLAVDGKIPCIEVGCGKRVTRIFKKAAIEEWLKDAAKTVWTPKAPEATPTIFKKPEDQPILNNPKKEELPVAPVAPPPPPEPERLRYKTKDLWEAAVLVADGFDLDEAHLDRVNNTWHFFFFDSSELRKLLADHNHGQLILSTRVVMEAMYKIKGIMNKHRFS